MLRWRRQSEALASGTAAASTHNPSATNGAFGTPPPPVRVETSTLLAHGLHNFLTSHWIPSWRTNLDPIAPNFGGLPSGSMFPPYGLSPIDNVNKRAFSSTSTTPSPTTAIPPAKRPRPEPFYNEAPPVTGGTARAHTRTHTHGVAFPCSARGACTTLGLSSFLLRGPCQLRLREHSTQAQSDWRHAHASEDGEKGHRCAADRPHQGSPGKR